MRLIKSSTYEFISTSDGEYQPRVVTYIDKHGTPRWADYEEPSDISLKVTDAELPEAVKSIINYEHDDSIEIVRDDGESVYISDFRKYGSFDKAVEAWKDALTEEERLYSSRVKNNRQIRSSRTSEPADSNSATDLYLYAKNSQNVYDRMVVPILENLSRKIRRGIYNGNKALNSFENIMDFAAQEYDRELGSGRGSLTLFNKATRREAAKKLMEHFEGDLYNMAGEVKSSLYKIYPTEGADNYQYKSFNSESEAEDFCKMHGYTKFEVINEHPFEKRINNSRAKRRNVNSSRKPIKSSSRLVFENGKGTIYVDPSTFKVTDKSGSVSGFPIGETTSEEALAEAGYTKSRITSNTKRR